MTEQKEMRLTWWHHYFQGEHHVGKGSDGLPRKSPTSRVPMFILLNIAMAPEI
jgi:hypothetical protein